MFPCKVAFLFFNGGMKLFPWINNPAVCGQIILIVIKPLHIHIQPYCVPELLLPACVNGSPFGRLHVFHPILAFFWES